jgi:hypothetical protein
MPFHLPLMRARPPCPAERSTGPSETNHAGGVLAARLRLLRRRLKLVTQALLVAIRLHALFAFVLVDFGLTTLFERSHV